MLYSFRNFSLLESKHVTKYDNFIDIFIDLIIASDIKSWKFISNFRNQKEVKLHPMVMLDLIMTDLHNYSKNKSRKEGRYVQLEKLVV